MNIFEENIIFSEFIVCNFLGGFSRVIVITDLEMILEGLKREEFSGRPDFEVWYLRSYGVRNRGVLVADGSVWSEQRRFSLRTLRDMGLGKQGMEGLITYELQELIELLKLAQVTDYFN